ncbi:LytR/AlgR family response regulator transcription factor [Psychroserpens sp.]|uniref:LytR/AlgR family response regulator transcription factor n=1 Tax=Psychroserpens sp. TaxID=2020870 RepID=UPI003C706EBC
MIILKAVIVEDSRLARNELKELIKAHEDIKLIGEAENVDEGYQLIFDTKPDLLFLDINMPEKDGFELLEMLDDVPITIFTTAFDEYAIKSFEYNAFDYLLKPINQKRFSRSIEKVIETTKRQLETPISEEKNNEDLKKDVLNLDKQIFIKDGEKCWLVKIKEISLFEIVGNYTRVFFDGNTPLIYKSLAQIEEKLPHEVFFRANRQQIINIHHVKKVVSWFNGKLKIELQSGEEIEISRRQSYMFKEQLSL